MRPSDGTGSAPWRPGSPIIDTGTLINFLAVDRLDLLAEDPRYRFIVTEHARLGSGECASIAAAVRRRFGLAIDDKLAARKARTESKELFILNTQQIMVESIRMVGTK